MGSHMKYLESSSHEEIGEFTGKYWGDYFYALRNSQHFSLEDRTFEIINDNYFYELRKYKYTIIRNDDFYRKIKYMERNLQKLGMDSVLNEMHGIVKGFNKSSYSLEHGKKIDLLHVLEFCCGEMFDNEQYFRDEYFAKKQSNGNCTTVIAKDNNSLGIIHSEEDLNGRSPLLPLAVKFKDDILISVSYPFQLLGSSCGMNKNICFQGNSIKLTNKYCKSGYNNDWQNRLPKTIFSRKLLDFNTMDDIKGFLTIAKQSLPSHNYIIANNVPYSCCITPGFENIDEQYCIFEIDINKKQFHANAFDKTLHNKFVSQGKKGTSIDIHYDKEWHDDSLSRINEAKEISNNFDGPVEIAKSFIYNLFLNKDKTTKKLSNESLGVFCFAKCLTTNKIMFIEHRSFCNTEGSSCFEVDYKSQKVSLCDWKDIIYLC
jgi:hypothetical protein